MVSNKWHLLRDFLPNQNLKLFENLVNFGKFEIFETAMDQTMTKSNYFGGLWTLSCFTSSISLDLILYNCLPLSRERCLQWRWYQWYHISNTASLYQELVAQNLSPHLRLHQFLQCNTVSLTTFLLWDYELKKFCDTNVDQPLAQPDYWIVTIQGRSS